MKIELNCQHCNKNFETEFKFRDKKFCSRECYFDNARQGKIKMGRNKDENIREERECKVCGTKFETKKKHFKKICSDECRIIWGKELKVKEKRLESLKKTIQEKYGVDHVWKLKEIHQKTIDNTNKELSVNKQKETVRQKTLKNLLPKLEANNLKLLSDYKANKNNNTSAHYQYQCTVCGYEFTSTLLGCGIIPRCLKCHPSYVNSKIQIFIKEFLNDNNIKYIQNDRNIINPLEMDFLLPDFNLGIETHGLYYHGETMGKDKKYHLNKSVMAEKKGIKLIQIFEDEILSRKEIVLSKLSHELKLNSVVKIDARKCVVKKIDTKIKKEFLDLNHLQGDVKDTLRYGLFYGEELVSVMTFGKRKFTRSKESNWELIRFCNKNNHSIRGGFNKLLKHILKDNNIESFITYSDSRWSGLNPNNTVYGKCGLTFVGNTDPNYWYFKSSSQLKRHHRFNFRKAKLISEGYDKTKTEWEIMQERGFDRIWDCGTMKFIYKK